MLRPVRCQSEMLEVQYSNVIEGIPAVVAVVVIRA
jgi:hypothetical protein